MNSEKKLYGAIVGYGFISSKGHMPAYIERVKNMHDVEIVAICDICLERIIDVPAGVKFYTDYKKLLNDEIRLRMGKNIVTSKSFMEMLEKTIKKFSRLGN